MQDTANAFRAGLVIVGAAVIAVWFFFQSRKSTLDDDNSVPYYAFLTDASGINAKSIVTVAGLQVGEIQKIELVEVTRQELGPDPQQKEGTLFDPGERVRVARVDMRIVKTVQIPDDTWLKKESLGLLGAKALFLEPGKSANLVAANGRIMRVRSVTATDALLANAENIVTDVRSITQKLDRDIGGITADLKGITGELNRFVVGDGERPPLDELYAMVITDLRRLSVTVERAVRDVNHHLNDNGESISTLMANLSRISSDIAELTGTGPAGPAGAPGAPGSPGTPGTVVVDGVAVPQQQQGDLRATMSSVRKISDDLSVVTGQLKSVLGDNEEEVGESVKQISHTIEELNRSLASLSEVVGRVERGEGTVGRLLTDEKMADKVEAAVNGASDYVATLTSIEAKVDVNAWYNFNRGGSTATLGLRLAPRPDKFYLVEIVDDGGALERLTRVVAPGPSEIRTTQQSADNSLRFTAMFAKRFFDFLVLRAGLIETSGGVGANVFLWDERIELRSDLYNFGGPRNHVDGDPTGLVLPRWRTMLKAQPIPFVYVVAGIDDVLNSTNSSFQLQPYTASRGFGFDYFLGLGLTFKDDDLRAILPFVPSF